MDHVPDGQAGVPILAAGEPAPLVDAFVVRHTVAARASGVLDGERFAVKDLFDVAGLATACGNPAWRATHEPATRDTAVVEMLLGAGATLVGKTRTDELAYALDGRNAHEGAPLNPAAPERLTGGSSSGTASAVAGGDASIGIGTDTAGSIRVPAAWCGLFGIRTTHGRIPREGLVALAPSFDTVGWMTRSGELLRRTGMALLDRGSSVAAAGALTLVRDPRLDALAEPAALPGLAAGFAAAGIDLPVDPLRAAEALRVLQGAEAWATHGDWITAVNPEFGPGIAERFALARTITTAQVAAAAEVRARVIAACDAALPAGHILVLPAVPCAPPLRAASAAELQSSRARLVPLTALASLTGRPQMTVPLRSAAGLPVGAGLMGWVGGDEALLEFVADRVFT